MANETWGSASAAPLTEASLVALLADGEALVRSGSSLAGETYRVEATEELTIAGSGDSLTATATRATASVWTGSPAGDITITTVLGDGESMMVALTHASGKKVTAFSQSGLTFDASSGSSALADISGDGSKTYHYFLTRRGSVVLYTIVADTP